MLSVETHAATPWPDALDWEARAAEAVVARGCQALTERTLFLRGCGRAGIKSRSHRRPRAARDPGAAGGEHRPQTRHHTSGLVLRRSTE